MAQWKKRLTQREKAERAALKKKFQAEGLIPPDKPRLNRRKFARETWAEFEAFYAENPMGDFIKRAGRGGKTAPPESLKTRSFARAAPPILEGR